MNKKLITLATVGLTVLSLAVASATYARESSEGPRGADSARDLMEIQAGKKVINNLNSGKITSVDDVDLNKEVQETVRVRPNGEFRVTGAVLSSVSGTVLRGTIMGVNVTVDAAGARVLNQTATGTAAFADFKAGDRINAEGVFDKNTKTVRITKIVDLNLRQANQNTVESRIQALLQLVEQLRNQLKNLR